MQPTKIEGIVQSCLQLLFKRSAVACDKGDGHADEAVHHRLHRRAPREQRDIRNRVGTHGEIDRPHDRQTRIDGQMHPCRFIDIDIVVRTKLRQMLLHIDGQTFFQRTRSPVRCSDGQSNKGIGKDRTDIREIGAYECLNVGGHPLHCQLHGYALNRISPRCKVDLHLCTTCRTHHHPRHRIADEQAVKDRTDDLRLLRRSDCRYGAPLHPLRRNRRNRTLHARPYNGWDRLIAYDNSRSLLHAGGLCGIDGSILPQNCEKEKHEHAGAHSEMRRAHQNVPPTRKWTRPPCEPRP